MICYSGSGGLTAVIVCALLASTLQFSGYAYQFVFGTEGYMLRHGGANFPEALRWLWRKEE